MGFFDGPKCGVIEIGEPLVAVHIRFVPQFEHFAACLDAPEPFGLVSHKLAPALVALGDVGPRHIVTPEAH